MSDTHSKLNSIEPENHRITENHRFLLGTLATGHLINDWVAGTIWLIAPAIVASMGFGPAEVGLIIAINGVAAGLTYVPAGIIADRTRNSGLLMLISFWWVAIGYFLSTFMPSFWLITLFLAIGVMGDAFWHPVATGVLVKTIPKRRAQVLGIHAMGGSVGAEILAPISIGVLLTYFDWQSSLQIATIPAFFMGVLFFIMGPKISSISRQTSQKGKLSKVLQIWFTNRGLMLIGMMVLYNMSLFAMLSMTPLTLQQRYEMSVFNSSVLFASMLVIGTLIQPVMGKLSDRIGRSQPIIITFLFSTLFAASAAWFESFLPFMFSLICAVSLLTAIRPIILATAVELSQQSESTTLGIVFAVLDGVGALGALVAGFVGEIDLALAFLMAAIFTIMSTGFYLASHTLSRGTNNHAVLDHP
ncbi:MAG: MFS transporter [Gammaproteobacteria bacterium]|nr:MFS transporter [Gammaproteobacteria bacterium]